jgi:hypothetical protein
LFVNSDLQALRSVVSHPRGRAGFVPRDITLTTFDGVEESTPAMVVHFDLEVVRVAA